MDEQMIDLRLYVEVLLSRWKWIVGLAVGAAIIALIVSLLTDPKYEASAIVIVTGPRYVVEFDPRFETEERRPTNQAIPSLAKSDDVLQRVVETYTPSPTAQIENWNLHVLDAMTEASLAGDPSLVILKVRSRSAREAAALANVWTDRLLVHGNELYGRSQGDIEFFENQLGEAKQALVAADAALVEFEARNPASILSNQLNSKSQAQTDYLKMQRTIAFLLQDIQRLQEQLADQPGDSPVSMADSLTTLLLQITALGAQTATPLELQITGQASFSDKNHAEQMALLGDLASTLEAKSAEIETRLAELEPEILALQQAIEQVRIERERLDQAQILASETYETVARKVDEARVAAQEERGMLQVGSYAAVPRDAVSPRKMLNTVVGGALGAFVAAIGVLLIAFWQRKGV
jgi:uncharacterized protein involved in exopolysaccharide biosynthesis